MDGVSRYNGTPRCRLCGSEKQITRHHLVPRRFRGRKLHRRVSAAQVGHRCNIVKLCTACHLGVEQNDSGMRMDLRLVLNANELRHMERVAGREWVDREYPRIIDVLLQWKETA